LKQNEAILKRVEALLGEREATHNLSVARAIEETGITKAWVMDRLRTNVARAMQQVQAVGPNGEVGDFKYVGAVANRALELLGKELGMFIDRGRHQIGPAYNFRARTASGAKKTRIFRFDVTR
jgi:hypothetical protein